MKKSQIIFLLCLLTSIAYGGNTWHTIYGEPGWSQKPTGLIPQSDGSMLIAGTTFSPEADSGDICLLKINASGDTVWTKTYGGHGIETTCQVVTLTDSTFLILANTSSFGNGSLDFWLLKVNSTGDTLWSKTFGGINDEKPTQLMVAPDGSILILGNTRSYGGGYENIWLTKANASGTALWTKYYSNGTCNSEPKMILLPDGSLKILTVTGTCGSGSESLWLLNINASGETMWTSVVYSGQSAKAIALTTQPDGSTLVLGTTDGQTLLAKVDANKNILWTKYYGRAYNDNPVTMLVQPDSSMVIAGIAPTGLAGTEQLWLIKTNATGDTLWTKVYGQPFGTYPVQTYRQPDGSIIILGRTRKSDSSSQETWFLKINQFGDTLWTKSVSMTDDLLPKQIAVRSDGSVALLATLHSQKNGQYICLVSLLLPDQITQTRRPVITSSKTSFDIHHTSSSSVIFSLPSDVANVDIFDINGRRVKKLTTAGKNVVTWNGENQRSNPVASGQYFAKIKQGIFGKTMQFTIAK